MPPTRYDAVVVGAGPAGAVAALVLARGGAAVALVDKAAFPRDKACGDLIGARGVQLLTDLGLTPPAHVDVGDMAVVGPTGGRALLPARAGLTYPGQGWAVARKVFDSWLREAAIASGAEPITARVSGLAPGAGPASACRSPVRRGARAQGPPDPLAAGVRLADDRVIEADVVIGADGATSVVAEAAGLVETDRILWGFAVRSYVSQPVHLPVIAFWDPVPGRGFPGYGWLFPGPAGSANVGLGLGTGTDRRGGAEATRHLDDFLTHLGRLGLMGGQAGGDGAGFGRTGGDGAGGDGTGGDGAARASRATPRLGGWLKLGMVGTVPARANVLLVGDAAGLVNPLQGEGIAQAIESGGAAARAVLAGPSSAAAAYRAHLRHRYLAYQAATASLHTTFLGRPRLISAVGRALTAPGAARTLGGCWALYWNDLTDGAEPSAPARAARLADLAARSATAVGRPRRWLNTALAE